MKSFFVFFNEIYENRSMLMKMSVRDFKSRYVGSYLGLIWGFFQPIITILVYWYVFEFGLKAGSRPSGVPFVIWMITGMIPWLYFSEALSGGTSSLIEYSYLVKKIKFKTKLLPVVKSLSSFFVYIIFSIINIIILLLYGYKPSVFWIQSFFYLAILYLFILGIILITSSITPFFRDLPQLITVILQLGFWITPIIWDYSIVPIDYQWILIFNPLFYIVEGYRNSFINNIWFWQQDPGLLVFGIITIIILIIGIKVFSKLETSFADLL